MIGKPNVENSRNNSCTNESGVKHQKSIKSFSIVFFPLILLPFLTLAQHNRVPEKKLYLDQWPYIKQKQCSVNAN